MRAFLYICGNKILIYMKRVLFLATMMMATFGFGQEKDSIITNDEIFTRIEKNDNLYDGITENSNGNCYGNNLQFPKYRDEETEVFFVNNIIKCKNDTFISGYYLGKQYSMKYDGNRPFFVNDKQDDIEAIIQKIKAFSGEQYINFVNMTKKSSIIYLLGKYHDISDKIDGYNKYSLGVIYARPKIDYSISGAEFKIYNASKKTIKYITFNFYAKNAVGDKVLYRKGAYSTSRKGIGPVEPYSTGAWEFDTVWLTDIVDELITTTIVVQYMDGTIKTIKMNDNMWMDDDLISKVNKLSDMVDENENIK